MYKCFIFTLLGFILCCSTVNADWYVDITNCPGPGTGTIGDPYCSIQDGINDAFSIGGGVVHVASGAYY